MQQDKIDWNHLCAQSPSELLRHHWTKMMWRAFAKHIPSHGKILEIGCGTGRIIAQACSQLASVGIGLDISFDALDYARRLSGQLGGQCHFVCGNGFKLPFADDSFDAVISEGVIEHFPSDQTESMIDEHIRVCKPKGVCIVSAPNLLNLPRTYHTWRTGPRFLAYPERSYTVWSLSSLLTHRGLKIVSYGGFAPTIGLEWYFSSRLRLHWIDRLVSLFPPLCALLGYETLVVGMKQAAS